MAGLTLSRVQHHLTQVTCYTALVGHRYVTQHSRVSPCECVCIQATINKGSVCVCADECDPVCESRCVLEKSRESCDVWAWRRRGLPPRISIALHHFPLKLLSWRRESVVPALRRSQRGTRAKLTYVCVGALTTWEHLWCINRMYLLVFVGFSTARSSYLHGFKLYEIVYLMTYVTVIFKVSVK